ncbi:hypothetical protein B9Z55_009459 [Caenorhabditis nigoni]|nr:hypothetical protein B9Z55_009459 [Caenorhabditis nigoni]
MKKLIQSSQMNRFKCIGSIVYQNDRTEQPCVHIPDKPFNKTIIKIVKHKKAKYNFQLNVCGRIIGFRLFTENRNGPYPVASFHPAEKQCVINSIHNHFLNLFGSSVEYHWRVQDFSNYYIPTIPKLQNVSFSLSLYLIRDFAHMRNLENFFSSSPVLKSLKLWTTKSLDPFNPESKFYQTESIEVQQLRHTFPDLLKYFQGKQAFISCGRCKILDLIEFVNKWKSGEGFRKLEYLEMKIVCHDVPENLILNGIGPKYIDATKQPPRHQVPKVNGFAVVQVRGRVIQCRFVGGARQGQMVLIPRIKLNYDFIMSRLQFSIRLSFAMTVNKSQGQTFEKIETIDDCEALWTKFLNELSEDFRHRGQSDAESHSLPYFDMAERMETMNEDLQKWIRCIYTRVQQYGHVVNSKKDTVEAILDSDGGLYFLDGPGGSGKNFVYNTLGNILMGEKKMILPMAWVGIAASLLPNGRTVASVCKLDINNGCRTSRINPRSDFAKWLSGVSLILWDEAPMSPKAALETVDTLFREIAQVNRAF